jgi:hypothetical protein
MCPQCGNVAQGQLDMFPTPFDASADRGMGDKTCH